MFELWLVVGGLLVALITLGIYTVGLSRRFQAQLLCGEQQLAKLRQEQAAINSAAIGVGQRLISAEKKLNTTIEQRETQASTVTGSESLLQAANCAQRGVTAQELVDRFGLSEAEAKLMSLVKMQRPLSESTGH